MSNSGGSLLGVELPLDPDTRSAGMARRFLAATLSGWGATAYREDGELLLSELVANAALHANTAIVVRVELYPEHLRLAVSDSSAGQPIVRHYSDQATTGRGLAMVGALARCWGIDPHPDGTKTVWAELASPQVNRGQRDTAVPTINLDAFPDLDEASFGATAGDGEAATFFQMPFPDADSSDRPPLAA